MAEDNNRPPLAWGGIAFVAAICSAIVAGTTLGRGAAMIALAAFAVGAAIAFFWQSLQGLSGDAPLTLEEALGLGAPSAEEERKQSVLRILKDLDYERAVGKLSDKDYATLSAKYRAEAKALLELVDDNQKEARERAERLLQERLAQSGAPETSASVPAVTDKPQEDEDEDEDDVQRRKADASDNERATKAEVES